MTTRQYRRCRVIARSGWKKPVASIVAACGGRNGRPVVPVRRCGAGGIFKALRTRRMAGALTRWPSLSSSPWIRWYPRPLFPVASRPVQHGGTGAGRRPSCPVRAGLLAGGEAAVPAQDGAGGDQPVHPQPRGAGAGSARRGPRGRPSPAEAAAGPGAARRPRAAAPAAQRPWRPMTGQAGPASRSAGQDEIQQAQGHGPSSCRTPDPSPSRQLTGPCRLLTPHRQFTGGGRQGRQAVALTGPFRSMQATAMSSVRVSSPVKAASKVSHQA
jgi:hypothetical protein